MAIVYKITNTVNGKMYIGATERTIEERWREHVNSSRLNKRNRLISRAIRKYGPEAFIREVLEEHPDRKYTFDVLEPKYILEHNTFGEGGYNMTGGSEGGIGHKHTEETKHKIRESLKKIDPRNRREYKPLSEKHRKNIGLSHLGRKLSEEAKEKLRAINTGKKLSEETKEKIRLSRLGKKHTPETIEKLRLAGLKRTHTEETKEKIRNINLLRFPQKSQAESPTPKKSRKLSSETREKIRIAALKRTHTPETREKIKQANMGKKLSPEHKENIRQSLLSRSKISQ